MTSTVRLRNIGTTYGGLTGKTKSDFGHGDASFVTFLEVINSTRLRGRALERVRVTKGERQSRVMRGDLLFNGSSETPEEVALSAVVDFSPEVSTFLNSFCFGFRLRPGAVVDPTYLAYFFRSSAGRSLVASLAQGATRYNIARSKFLDVELNLPAVERQREIAASLGDADDLIATLERLIAKKRAIKQGMMQQLLTGRTRLPGFTDPWIEARLGSLGTCIRGVSYDPTQDLSVGDQAFTIRLLRSNNVQNGRIDRDGLQFVHERRVSSVQILAPGDIVICMANGSRDLVGKAALFEPTRGEPRYTFGAFMGAFRTNNSVADQKFVAETMGTQAFRAWLDLILSGSSINNLRPSDVEGFVTSMPPLAEQAAIAEVLAEADAEIDALRVRLSKTRAIKQGMLQRLLTGRTRLPLEHGGEPS